MLHVRRMQEWQCVPLAAHRQHVASTARALQPCTRFQFLSALHSSWQHKQKISDNMLPCVSQVSSFY